MNNIDILYILGTGYCGSTALEMSLGAHENIINLGEINRILNFKNKTELDNFYNNKSNNKNNLCSCGNRTYQCSYWQGFYSILLKNINKSFKSKYLIHYQYFKSFYPNKILIDSSKDLWSLKELDFLIHENKLIPLLLVKDVRNWTTSVQNKHKGSAIKRYIGWYVKHKKYLNYTNRLNNLLLFGYEEFALFPEIILNMITKALDLNFDDKMLNLNNNNGHAIFSNRMRYDDKKKSKIFYDYRWFNNKSLYFASIILPFVMNLNSKIVYSNLIIENNFNYSNKKKP